MSVVGRKNNFYGMSPNCRVEYDERKGEDSGPVDALEFKEVFQNILNVDLLLYDRVALNCEQKTTIKYLAELPSERRERPFMFAFKNYEKRLTDTNKEVTRHCEALLEKEPNRKVRHLCEVPIGGIFGLKDKDNNSYIRVRITEVHLNESRAKYWAVDAGHFGECHITELIHLNRYCLTLTMLAVPGVITGENASEQREKIKDGKFRLVRVCQPKVHCDYGPRKISF